jgi:hypothetical protein
MEKANSKPSFSANGISLQLRSKEVSEVMGNIPRWIGSWGTFLIILLFTVSMLIILNIHCVQRINARAIITISQQPIQPVVKKKLIVKKVWPLDGSLVKEKDTLFTVRSPWSNKAKFILSPAAGWFLLRSGIQDHDTVKAASPMFSIVPASDSNFLNVFISSAGLSKINGQKKLALFFTGENKYLDGTEFSIRNIKAIKDGYVMQAPLQEHTIKEMLLHNKSEPAFKNMDCQIVTETSIFKKLTGWLFY